MEPWVKLVLGGLVGPNPTDRGKAGTKRNLLVEGQGGPLGVVIAGASVHDTKLLEATLDAIVVERPTRPPPNEPCPWLHQPLAIPTMDTTKTTISVDDGTQFHIGQTIMIGTEQMLITNIAGNDLTWVPSSRNGWTAGATATSILARRPWCSTEAGPQDY